MKLSELKVLIDRWIERDPDAELHIKVFRESVGQTATVKVKGFYQGFDWDQGRILIYPETDLREISQDEKEKIRKELNDLGWLHYAISNLKSEIKRKDKEIEKLKSSEK